MPQHYYVFLHWLERNKKEKDVIILFHSKTKVPYSNIKRVRITGKFEHTEVILNKMYALMFSCLLTQMI